MRGGAAREVAVAQQHQLRLRQQRGPRAQSRRPTLADQLAAADYLRPGLRSPRGGVVARSIVGNEDLRARKCRRQRGDRIGDSIALVVRSDHNR